MELPFAQRELNLAARSKGTYVLRTLLAGSSVAILFGMIGLNLFGMVLMSGPRGMALDESFAERLGGPIASLVEIYQYIVVFIIGPLFTAGLVAHEKQEKTLGLLLLADMSGWDLFFAKFLRAFLQMELLLLSFLPLVAFAAFFGGVVVPEATLTVVLLSVYTAAICATGLLFSTLAERAAMAFFLNSLFVWGWLIGGFFLNEWVLRAFRGWWDLSLTPFDESRLTLARAWPQFAFAGFIFIAASALTVYLLPRQAYGRSARWNEAGVRRWMRQRRHRRYSAADRFLASSGVGLAGNLRSFTAKSLVFVGLAALSAVPCGASYIVIILMCYDIIVSMVTARTDGALDELVLTPMTDRALGRTIFRASLRHARFYGAALICGSATWPALSIISMIVDGGVGAAWSPWVSGIGYGGAFQFEMWLATLFGGLLAGSVVIALRVAAMAAGAAYLGLQRGTPLRLTLGCLGTIILIDLSVGFPSTIILLFASSMAGMGGENWMEVLAAILIPLLSGVLYTLPIYVFWCLLTQGTRRRLQAATAPPASVPASAPVPAVAG